MATQRHRESSEIGAMAQRVMRALVRRAAEGDTEALEVLVTIQAEASDHIASAGQELVTFGYSYGELASVLGVTRQAARQRFAPKLGATA